MKTILLILILLYSSFSFAQWSNTTNDFADSLHMPVSVAKGDQERQIVINSFPDNGYIIIWEDHRNFETNKRDIYAQKFDKDGHILWTENGIPVATGPNDQYYTRSGATGGVGTSSDSDYRNYSYAATDSAGGFYIAWKDDSIATHVWGRIGVQHILSNGTTEFPEEGIIVAETPMGYSYDFSFPQVIADGRKGFFLSYLRNLGNTSDVIVHCYRHEGNQLVSYGSGLMNQNGIPQNLNKNCSAVNTVEFYPMEVYSYYIWPDLQGGCNVVMGLRSNAPADSKGGGFLAYNRMCRIKQSKKVKILQREDSVATKMHMIAYSKNEVVPLYQLITYTDTTICYNSDSTILSSTPSSYIENSGTGYLILDHGYDFRFSKGATIKTVGNINIDVMAATKRIITTTGSISSFTPTVYALPSEKYDTIPFQLDSNDEPYIARRNAPKGKVLDKVNILNDTLLKSGINFFDFAFKASAEKLYAAALIAEQPGEARSIYFQQLELTKPTSDSFAITFSTNSKSGIMIGRENVTGFFTNSISYDNPAIAVDQKGNALFYITDQARFIRLSPVSEVAQLKWGAMGKRIGTGYLDGAHYQPAAPVVALDPYSGSGVICWSDHRVYVSNTAENIVSRQLSVLFDSSATPNQPVKKLAEGVYSALPEILLGSSGQFSALEVLQDNEALLPVAEIQDTYNTGMIEMSVFQHSGSIRKYQDTAYLNLNYFIKAESDHPHETKIRLYFSKEDFELLQTNDSTIKSPEYLMVVGQPNNSSVIPELYLPVKDEIRFTPISWQKVNGGFFIEFKGDFNSNFFIMKNSIPGFTPVSVRPAIIENIVIHPNPFESELYLTGLITNDKISISDMANRILRQETIISSEHVLSLRELPEGIYFITVTRGGKMEVFKIIKM